MTSVEGYPNVLQYMTLVAHPQLTEKLYAINPRLSLYSSVQYDLVNYFRVSDVVNNSITCSFLDHHKLSELIARGQLWQCRETILFRGMWAEMPLDGGL